jgi:nitronate monooxygenase
MWPDRRIIDLFKTEFPILLAPMAGVMDQELAIAAAQGGALASLPCAMISADKADGSGGSHLIMRSWVSIPRHPSMPPTARRSTKRCANWWKN